MNYTGLRTYSVQLYPHPVTGNAAVVIDRRLDSAGRGSVSRSVNGARNRNLGIPGVHAPLAVGIAGVKCELGSRWRMDLARENALTTPRVGISPDELRTVLLDQGSWVLDGAHAFAVVAASPSRPPSARIADESASQSPSPSARPPPPSSPLGRSGSSSRSSRSPLARRSTRWPACCAARCRRCSTASCRGLESHSPTAALAAESWILTRLNAR